MPPNTKIKFYGTSWCPDSRRAKKFLTQKGVAFEWINIDEDAEGRAYVEKVNNGMRRVPAILFPDGTVLVEPSKAELAQKLGL